MGSDAQDKGRVGQDVAPEAPGAPERRSLWNRATDEVAALFGDAKAAGRRQRDSAAGDHSGQGPKSDLDPDARIVNSLSQRLTADAGLDASKIEIAAVDGVVTLNGSVTTSAEKRQAEDLAAATAGVSQVHNRLLVA